MKLTHELIDDYLAGSLAPAAMAKLELWLKSHPADAGKVKRQRALNEALARSAPVLSSARSKQLWANIKARVEAEQAAAPVIVLGRHEPWYAFLFRPWGGAGVVTAGLALAILVWHPWGSLPSNSQAPSVARAKSVVAASVPARRVHATGAVAKPKVEAAAMVASAVPAPAPARVSEPTEVEKALADSGVDGMIDAYLEAQRHPGPSGNLAGLSRSNGPGLGQGGSSSLAGFTQSVSADSEMDPASSSAAKGSQDNNGFWNWSPAAIALNHHDWTQVKVELDAARGKAAEASERAFATSALTLLSAPGAPLAGQGDALPSLGELRVLGAGRWQLLVDNRLARFSQGVSTRLPGFRAEGDSLLLDLTFDRGTFAPGTRFTRMAGEAPAEVLDAQGQALSGDEFSAPSGATYNISGRQLKLR